MTLEQRCELGQSQLMQMQYIEAEGTLALAEQKAWDARQWDLLSRLYMPLQETRRQIRQRCSEGIFACDFISNSADQPIDPAQIIEQVPHGQILVAGWQSLSAAVEVRRLAYERKLYVEVFLAAAFPSQSGTLVAVAPFAQSQVPADCLMLPLDQMPTERQPGTSTTFGYASDLWDRLALPFFKAAELETDPVHKIDRFRTTIQVDNACELAHQYISQIAAALQ